MRFGCSGQTPCHSSLLSVRTPSSIPALGAVVGLVGVPRLSPAVADGRAGGRARSPLRVATCGDDMDPDAVNYRKGEARVGARGSAEAGGGRGDTERGERGERGGRRARERTSSRIQSPAAAKQQLRPRPCQSRCVRLAPLRLRPSGLPRMEDSQETSPSSNNSSEELSSALHLSKGMSIFLDVSTDGGSWAVASQHLSFPRKEGVRLRC